MIAPVMRFSLALRSVTSVTAAIERRVQALTYLPRTLPILMQPRSSTAC